MNCIVKNVYSTNSKIYKIEYSFKIKTQRFGVIVKDNCFITSYFYS